MRERSIVSGGSGRTIPPRFRARYRAAAPLGGFLVLVFLVAVALPAYAAGSIAVTTKTDEFNTTGTGTGCSLREAIRTANIGSNFGGCALSGVTPFTINVPAGTYDLTITGSNEALDATGDLDVRATGTAISGAGASSTIIQWGPAVLDANRDRVLEVNPSLGNGFAFTVSGVTIAGGRDHSFGGGGMSAGSFPGSGGSVSVADSRFTDDEALSPSSSPVGGAISTTGGSLTVSNTTFDGNSAFDDGGAIYYDAFGTGSLSIAGSTFSSNSSSTGNGGAVWSGATTGSGGPASIGSSTFSQNAAPGTGGAVFADSGTLDVSTTAFLGNQVTNALGRGGAIGSRDASGSDVTVAFSRLIGNAAATPANGATVYGGTSGSMLANDDWWGVNTGPAADDAAGISTASTWLQLRHGASPSSIGLGGSSSLTADILGRNLGGPASASDLVGLPAFPSPAGTVFGSAVKGALSGASTQFVDGLATATFTAGTTSAACGTGSADATADGQTVGASITIGCPDLSASKTNDVNGDAAVGQTWTWTITVANDGDAGAAFSKGQTLLRDDLPDASSLTFGTPVPSNPAVDCAVDSNTDLLCSAGSAVSLPPTGSFTVQLTGTADAPGSFDNPRANGVCAADPADAVVESHEDDNSCSDTVGVSATDTTTTITSDLPDPSVTGQAATVAYVVTPTQGSGSPTGSVTVSDGVDSCTATVATGHCSIAFPTAGARNLTATYAGDGNFNGSTSAVEPHQVDIADTTTTILSDSPDPSDPGEFVVVAYDVAVSSPGSGTPTGNVTVGDGVDSCTGTVAAGQCSIALSTSGARTLTASYGGDADFSPGTSSGEPHTVNSVGTNSPPVAAVRGGSCSTSNDASGTIELAVSDPDGDPLTVTVGSNTNPALVPNGSITIGGSGPDRTMTVTAAARATGTTEITLDVSDGTATTPIVVTVIVGTDRSESLAGTNGADMIFGLNGSDAIDAGGGNDLVCGGNGADTLAGGAGNDTLEASTGGDTMNGGDGDDTLRGGNGSDLLTGGAGADAFSGDGGHDVATDFNPSEGDTQDGSIP